MPNVAPGEEKAHEPEQATDQPASNFFEKDLGVLLDTINQRCTLAAKKAISILGCIKKSAVTRLSGVILHMRRG